MRGGCESQEGGNGEESKLRETGQAESTGHHPSGIGHFLGLEATFLHRGRDSSCQHTLGSRHTTGQTLPSRHKGSGLSWRHTQPLNLQSLWSRVSLCCLSPLLLSSHRAQYQEEAWKGTYQAQRPSWICGLGPHQGWAWAGGERSLHTPGQDLPQSG